MPRVVVTRITRRVEIEQTLVEVEYVEHGWQPTRTGPRLDTTIHRGAVKAEGSSES